MKSILQYLRGPFLFIVLIIVASLGLPPQLPAHQIGQSYIFLRVYDDALSGRFEITLRDLNNALGLIHPEEQITEVDLQNRILEVQKYYLEKVRFYEGDKQLSIHFEGFNTRQLPIGMYVLLEFSVIDGTPKPDAIEVDYNVLFDKNPDHLGLLVIEHFWNANLFNNERHVSLVFSPATHRQLLSFSNHSRLKGFLGIVKMGVKHIWIGIDHLLFLLALILPAAMLRRQNQWTPVASFRPAIMYTIKIVTLFTIAHSITLSIAAVGVFNLPSRLVESIIALSIIITALDIIFPIFQRKIWLVVFIFGLFHGFGFAGVLADLGVLGENFLLSLLGFNLGVEIGQIVVIGCIFPVIYFASKYRYYPRFVMRYGAVAMIIIAAYWFVERAFLSVSIAKLMQASLSGIIN